MFTIDNAAIKTRHDENSKRICESVTDFTNHTSLHGLRYVGDSNLHPCERLFWGCGFILSMVGVSYYISSIYLHWSDSPMIVSMSPVPALLESIPFPALTICNMNGAKKSLALGIMTSNKTDNETLAEKSMIYDMCDWNSPLSYRPSANWSTVQKFIIKVSQPCHDMLVACYWRNQEKRCDDIFNPELTDEGMCCAFNKVHRDFIYRNPKQVIGLMNYTFPFNGVDWTPEKGYEPGTPTETNPWRAWGSGRSMGLTLVLDVQLDEYYCSSTASAGFKAMLHNPVEAPKISDYGFYITAGKETRIEVQPKISTSALNLEHIAQEKRLCVFPNDRILRFYRTYTQRNCQLECQSNFTLERCKCVPFYLPKDIDIATCATEDTSCVDQAKAEMDSLRVELAVNMSDIDAPAPSLCKCFPSCDTVEYTRQMTTAPLEDNFKVKEKYLLGRDTAYYKRSMAVTHFFFTENSFTSVEKGEIFGFTEFLSNTGGILGLFLGFSLMSAVEIIYFVSLRLFCSYKRTKKALFHKKPIPFLK